VGLAGEGGECGGDFVEVCRDVGGCCACVVLAGVAGAGDGVAVVAFDPGEGGVAEPVGGDLLGGDPGEVLADAGPEVVVAAGGDGVAVAVAEQLFGGGAASLLVVDEGGGDGLPAGGAAFLVEVNEALFGVEVAGRRASAPPRRQAVSVWSLRRRVSSSGSLPVVAAVWMISASRWLGRARRLLGSRRGFVTRRAGLSPSVMSRSAMAWR
jgi:hypothetical protein